MRWFALTLLVCIAAAPTTQPSPEAMPTGLQETRGLDVAETKLANATAAVDTARVAARGRFETGAGKAMAAEVAEKLNALERARVSGTPQDRLNASSAYNVARLAMDKVRAEAIEADPMVKSALQSRAQAEKDLEAAQGKLAIAKALVEKQQADAKRAADAALEAEREKKLAIYKESMETSGHSAGPRDSIPLGGDETTLKQMLASPQEFIDKQVVVCGGATVQSFYNWGFRDAQRTHYSIHFVEFDSSAHPGESANLYVKRGFGDDLADTLIATSKARADAYRLVRLRLTIPKDLAEQSISVSAEITDWQFELRKNGKTLGWGPWASEVKPPSP